MQTKNNAFIKREFDGGLLPMAVYLLLKDLMESYSRFV